MYLLACKLACKRTWIILFDLESGCVIHLPVWLCDVVCVGKKKKKVWWQTEDDDFMGTKSTGQKKREKSVCTNSYLLLENKTGLAFSELLMRLLRASILGNNVSSNLASVSFNFSSKL